MIKKAKIQKLNREMDKFASQIAKKQKKDLTGSVIELRREEDERL